MNNVFGTRKNKAFYSVWSNVHRKVFIVGQILCCYPFPYASKTLENTN